MVFWHYGVVAPSPLADNSNQGPLQERLARVIIEQPRVPDIARQNLHGAVPTDLLDLPDIGAGARGRGHEARPERVPAIAGRIHPGRRYPGLLDTRDRVIGQAALPH